MRQSRLASFGEAAGNTASGFLISLAVQWTINFAYGLPLALHDDIAIVSVFTASSFARTYAWRRLMQRLCPPAPPAGPRARITILQRGPIPPPPDIEP